METIKFEKLGKEGKIYVDGNRNVIITEWDGKTSVINEINEDHVVFIYGFDIDGKRCNGFKFPEETVKKIKNLKEKLDEKINQENEKHKNNEMKKPLSFVVCYKYIGNDVSQDILVPNKDREFWTEEEKKVWEKCLGGARQKMMTYNYGNEGILAHKLGIEEGEKITLKELYGKLSEEIAVFEKTEEEKQKEKRREENELKEKQQKAIEEARKTGNRVIIRKIGGYDGDEAYPDSEKGWVNVYEYATPEGKIVEGEVASY